MTFCDPGESCFHLMVVCRKPFDLKNLPLSGTLLLLMFALASCVEAPFRTGSLTGDPSKSAAANPCTRVHALGPANLEIIDRQQHACGLQQHVLPSKNLSAADARTITGADLQFIRMPMNAWTDAARALVPARDLNNSDAYTLAFVELDEAGLFSVDTQRRELRAHLQDRLAQGQQNVVIVYVHGFRHDAGIRNADAVKFRRLLGYTRAALNTRCIEAGQYCDAALTGVFVGWPGRRINEGFQDQNVDEGLPFRLGTVSALAGFGGRYDLSCKLGSAAPCHTDTQPPSDPPLRQVLSDIEGQLRPFDQSDPSANKLLVFGHSLGGNMLATMLRDEVEAAVRNHRPGARMKPPIGDLVVLLNPASPAENWTGIQRAERKLAGLGETNILTCEGRGAACFDRYFAQTRKWHSLYPTDQRPVYISLTATANWGALLNRDAPDYDKVTDKVFKLAQKTNNRTKREEYVTIGHLMPQYKDRRTLQDGAEPVGATHEMAVLWSAGVGVNAAPSTYANATRPAAAWCAPSDGWLALARRPKADDTRDIVVNWDYGYLPKRDGQSRPSRNVGADMNNASIRWRQAVRYTSINADALSVAPGTTPFWNVRVLDTAIRKHADWAKYPTWCAINQLFLDNATAPKAAPTVRRVFDDAADVGAGAGVGTVQE